MNILFVCTGNTCRSPMAEAIARQFAADRQLDKIEVKSAGTSAYPGAPASDGSLLVALEQDLDLSQHRAQELSAQLVRWADVILVMGAAHLDEAASLGGTGKSYLLSDYASRGENVRAIVDPFGGDLSAYRATFVELAHEIGNVLDRVMSEREQRPV
ncbi:MAG: low molecular weight protein arginine phosphatase [Gemmatimonadota bacterium]|nr:low molecular weight protein arginine phosphatase [Gemmatimonadota bacterium]